ncbi:hypothetical protein [Microcystis phage Mwe-JY26]
MPLRETTVNRGWLRRRIEAGEVEAKCDGKYTDDYAWDAATDFGKTDWLPARVRPEGELWSDAPGGFITFDPSDFRGFGNAWKREDGTMVLSFGYKSYSLRLKTVEVKVAA